MNKLQLAVISLGCDKNRVDTENMLHRFVVAGHSLTSDYASADVIVVNTCAFIESARIEAIETILDAANYKKTGNCKKLIVTGCLPQKHAAEIAKDLPEVDAFLGVKDYDGVIEVLSDLFKDDGQQTTIATSSAQIIQTSGKGNVGGVGRYLTTPQHYAYLRVSDGCDNHCTYCTIPSIRGKFTSVGIERLETEAKFLMDSGARELILVAQDTTSYGKDIYNGQYKLVQLLEKLTALDIDKVRLMYCYPHLIGDDLLAMIAGNNKIAKYIDMPVQHVDTRILKLMNRPTTYESLCTLVEKIRAQKKPIAIRTTLMVGFPSETDKEFDRLYNFVKTYALDHVGAFMYSQEEGTPAAKLPNQVEEAVKLERFSALGTLHLDNTLKRNKMQVGKTLPVVYEGIDFDKNLFYGRTEYNAPDIDTLVYFKGEFADVGKVYNVKITDFDQYDLVGEMEN